jgi:GT2 family glycosyltransferase
MAGPELSVVIPAAGRAQHLRRCIEALVETPMHLEVVVVDLSADGSVEVDVERLVLRHSVQVLRCAPLPNGSLRVGAGRNAGAAAATGLHLCFLDVDCVVPPSGLSAMTDRLIQRGVTVLMPPVRFLRADWVQQVRNASPAGTGAWMAASDAANRPAPTADRIARPTEIDLFWSLAFCCTADTYERTGGFDDAYVGYGAEDTDFARRATQAGVTFVWLSDPTVFHQYHPPSRLDPDRLPELLANARRFHRRWGDWPMRGWLTELAERGVVRWDETSNELELTGDLQ